MNPAKFLALFGRRELGGTTTFNPSDKGASVTLSSGNRTMAKAGVGPQMVRSTTSHATTGKYYSEFRILASSGAVAVGQSGAAGNLNAYVGSDTAGLGYAASGSVFFGGAVIATYSTFAAGDVIAAAHDFAAGKLWFSKNGVWQSGDPEAGTGGLSIVNTLFLAASAENGDSARINCGQDPFILDVPPGFGPWG